MATETDTNLTWRKVLEPGELADGRVKPVTCGHTTLCMTRHQGRVGALDNRCPHQGGPLGEGSIENGLLRCPWHGWDYDPLTGRAPGFDDGVQTFPVEEREDGVYVGLPPEAVHLATVTDVVAETLVNWGIRHVLGMVGHSNLGLADALRRQVEAGKLSFYGIRHEGAAAFAASAYGKLTGRPAACLAIAGPGATNLLTGLWDANVDRSPVIALTGQVDTQVLGPGAFQEIDLAAAFGKVAQWSQPVLGSSRHAELVNLAARTAILNRGVSHLIFPDEVQTRPAPEGAKAGGPAGRLTPRTIAPPRESLDQALELHPRLAAAGDHRRPRRPLRDAGDPRAGRAAGRAGPHHLQGQGADLRPPSAGLRRAGPQRHADRQLVHERVRRAGGLWRLLLEPHRHHAEAADRPGRLRPDGPRQVPRRQGAGVGRDRGHRSAARRRAGRRRRRRRPGRPAARDRRALAHLARREGAPAGRGARPGGLLRGHLRRHEPARAGRRHHRRRRRQQHLLVRPLLRVPRAGGPDVGLPGLDRLRLSGGDGRLGGDPRGRPALSRAAGGGGLRRRRLSASTWAS